MIEFRDIQQRTDEWFNYKLTRFSATSIDSLNAKETTADFMDEINRVYFGIKTGKRPMELDLQPMGFWVKWGNEHEHEGIEYLQNKYFTLIKNGGIFLYDDWFCVSPDGVFDSETLVEVKSVKYSTLIKYHEKGILPDAYYWQVHAQLLGSGFKKCIFIAHHPQCDENFPPFEITVNRDETICKEIFDKIIYAKSLVLKKLS
jgi:hypothetical protein